MSSSPTSAVMCDPLGVSKAGRLPVDPTFDSSLNVGASKRRGFQGTEFNRNRSAVTTAFRALAQSHPTAQVRKKIVAGTSNDDYGLSVVAL